MKLVRHLIAMDAQLNIPPTCNYNPSSWPRRIPLMVLALIGFCIAAYLAFYQMHIVSNAWDPFFGDGTKQVLTSKFSKKFPIPDALLGAFGYLLDLILEISGRTDRWRSQPWIVLLLGVVVSLLALTGFLLILAQIFLIHKFCTLCLASAIISFIIAALATKEILASIHFIRIRTQETGSFWKAIFKR